jgi:hypothetical protein
LGTADKVKSKLDKDVLNIIRTSMRNNMDLTHIADNKANVLLSLNALMITFLVPYILTNFEFVLENGLGIPLLLLLATSLITIYISVLVLIPRGITHSKTRYKAPIKGSPFFFGSFQNLTKDEYMEYIDESIVDKAHIGNFVKEDLYYVGMVLARKMKLIRLAFRIFLVGFLVAIISATAVMIFHTLSI